MHNLNNTVQAQRSAVTGKQYAICVSERRDILHIPDCRWSVCGLKINKKYQQKTFLQEDQPVHSNIFIYILLNNLKKIFD